MARHVYTKADLEKMTEGERLIYLITTMDSNCEAVEKLIKVNSYEHKTIQTTVAITDNEIFKKISDLQDDIKAIRKETPSNKLFYSSMALIVAVLLGFAGVLYDSGKEVTKNTSCIKSIERTVYINHDTKENKNVFKGR